VLLDAQATGLPIISTTHCDIPEEVVHGRTGLLTPESDAEALAGSIETFYKMPEETYSVFSRQAREHVVSEYDIATNARQLLAEYKRVLSGFPDDSTN
jgi:colanic acid/amylovoran biosynthesis glycosyltransferase